MCTDTTCAVLWKVSSSKFTIFPLSCPCFWFNNELSRLIPLMSTILILLVCLQLAPHSIRDLGIAVKSYTCIRLIVVSRHGAIYYRAIFVFSLTRLDCLYHTSFGESEVGPVIKNIMEWAIKQEQWIRLYLSRSDQSKIKEQIEHRVWIFFKFTFLLDQ